MGCLQRILPLHRVRRHNCFFPGLGTRKAGVVYDYSAVRNRPEVCRVSRQARSWEAPDVFNGWPLLADTCGAGSAGFRRNTRAKCVCVLINAASYGEFSTRASAARKCLARSTSGATRTIAGSRPSPRENMREMSDAQPAHTPHLLKSQPVVHLRVHFTLASRALRKRPGVRPPRRAERRSRTAWPSPGSGKRCSTESRKPSAIGNPAIISAFTAAQGNYLAESTSFGS